MRDDHLNTQSGIDERPGSSGRTLVVIDPHFPFYDRWSFLEDEAAFLAEHPQTRYQVVEFISTPVRHVDHDVRSQARFAGSRAMKLGVLYRPLRSWTTAALQLFSTEATREWKDSRKLKSPPSLFFAYKRMFQYFLIAAQLECHLRGLLQHSSASVTLYSYWLSLDAYGIAKLKKRYPAVTALSRCHGSEVNDTDVYVPFRKTIDKNLDEIFFVAENRQKEYNRIRSDLGIEASNGATQAISRLGITVPPSPTSPPKDQVLHILTVSSVERNKRLDLIIDGISATDFPIKWTHIGDGPLLSETEALAQMVVSNRPEVSVEFTGRLPREDVLDFASRVPFDVFVNMSDSEGVPVSMMEAMGYGIPAIGRAVGGIPELIDHDESGIILPADGNGEDLSLALNKFRPSPDGTRSLRAKLSMGAREKILREYDLESNLSSFYEGVKSVEHTVCDERQRG